ncbi:MAG: bifunctional phosphopantothenoylcysteine decarboxylase/phosphopantothenate--cysteine ligase CoaBC [Gammaproteobacteria bacterium]|nr:bifunctional phosphopantothenoylcysteine decarboxylase/phosphopantothenate--cysteine ligase CoaBC [Gammaproteobacteria bacterium]MDH5650446.1 bifunctional phosphopantothenoylcysteine decarboxylase/phosphopantothenate--cysteine ligase CoaBC [Gammaproteobacteria bacterium]
MTTLTNKRIVLGVTGSIAAYKSAELTRRLRDAGADVRVVMTRGAEAFITPLTLQAVSGHPVHRHLLDTEAEAGMGHIELARWADAILVAPCSANFLAALAAGRADELLGAVCLAGDVPLALAPAMNGKMWQDKATADNIRLVSSRGILLFGPDDGEQACGEVGTGRMREVDELVTNLADLFETGSLTGKTVLVTAGPTREAIDPVRFISNHSSGKMGYAIAAAAVEAGAKVLLVSGPVSLPCPDRVTRIDVESAEQMLAAVEAGMSGVDILIATAAVADYRPVQVHAEKMKKQGGHLSLELEPTPDILATIKAAHPKVFSVGFAAETTQLEEYAQRKLVQKGIEMIAANLVGPAATETGGTFGSDTNALHLFWANGNLRLPVASKDKLARLLIAHVAQYYSEYQFTPRVSGGKVVKLVERTKPAG